MSPQDESNKILEPCPSCATLIDVTDCEPFIEIHCPICGARMRVRRQFNNFALQKILGEGGMGTVFEALDVNLFRPVALKILKKEYSQDEASIALLETEARITASINHPHVVKVFSAGRDHGQFYLAMELVGQGTLDQLMSLQIRVAEIQVLDVGIQIADGLRAALQKGLIHRDVKPGNILFADAHTSKIVDFGLALLEEEAARERGEIWGTPYYVAPEKLNNEPEDFRSDIYSLGGTLFHAISGRPPFDAASASLVALKHLKSQAVSLQAFAPDVSNETAYVINRMLNKDPFERYQSYDELIEHLAYAKAKLLDRSVSGHRNKPRVVVETDENKTFTGWITLALIVAVLGVCAFFWIKRDAFFGPPPKIGTASTSSGDNGQNDDPQTTYEQGRQMLAKGDTAAANGIFDGLLTAQTPPAQPLLNWTRTGKGLGLLMGGQLSEGRDIFGKMHDDGMYSTEASDNLLANFFVELGRLMSNDKTIPGTTTKVYSNTNFEAYGLLIFAIKDWQLGKFDDAGPLLEKFAAAKPVDDYAWISDFLPLAQKYLADYTVYHGLRQQVDAASTPALRAAALQAVREARSKLLLQGTLPELLSTWESKLSGAVSTFNQQDQARQAAQALQSAQTEKTAWEQRKLLIERSLQDFAPEKILATPLLAPLTDASYIAGQNLLLKRVGQLAEFKNTLIQALASGSYHGSVITRKGATLTGGITKADQSTVCIKSNYGTIPILWKDLQPSSLADLALATLPSSDNTPRAAHNQWLLGAYYMTAGIEEKGRLLLIGAAQKDPSLNDQLATYLDTASAATP